jgi:hypothetical protein
LSIAPHHLWLLRAVRHGGPSRTVDRVPGTDAMVAITKVTAELPSPQDTDRVRARLVAAGWPVDDSWGWTDK